MRRVILCITRLLLEEPRNLTVKPTPEPEAFCRSFDTPHTHRWEFSEARDLQGPQSSKLMKYFDEPSKKDDINLNMGSDDPCLVEGSSA
ncbi:hypothetical protein AVEN_72813-1 [Araneus ventricosus]|uniref:Uncharacterized protein n=1 Tax=Araneus ventricosus TaxID=182803 RepID=A0A4Y2S0C2_ARAVE|nr:hypothetical protein AVEN_72813-1 [Araneus ventricosus]